MSSLVAWHLTTKDMKVLNYINDFAGMQPPSLLPQTISINVKTSLYQLGLTEAEHKAIPPHNAWSALVRNLTP